MLSLKCVHFVFQFYYKKIIIIIIIIIIIVIYLYTKDIVYSFFPTSFNKKVFTEVWLTASLSRTLLSILTDFNSAVVWMVLILSLISHSSCLFSWPLGIVSKDLTTIGMTKAITTTTFFFFFFFFFVVHMTYWRPHFPVFFRCRQQLCKGNNSCSDFFFISWKQKLISNNFFCYKLSPDYPWETHLPFIYVNFGIIFIIETKELFTVNSRKKNICFK